MSLDNKDHIIVDLIEANHTIVTIEKMVGISRTAIYKRLRRLKKLGILRRVRRPVKWRMVWEVNKKKKSEYFDDHSV